MKETPPANHIQPATDSVLQQSPTFQLTPPTENNILNLAMPAGASVTQEQVERDILRTRKEMERLKETEAALLTVLRAYFPRSTFLLAASAEQSETAGGVTDVPIQDLSIAEACDLIFRDLNNAWLTLADLDMELKQRGKVCSKGSIEIMLKNSGRFEIEKRGKKNVYRRKE